MNFSQLLKQTRNLTLIGATILLFSQCNRDDHELPTIADNPVDIDTVDFDATPYDLDFGSFPAPKMTDNMLTTQGVKLGRMLFYETMMSRDNSISCASCHKQENAFSDPDQFSSGVDGSLGKRQAMSVFNLAWHTMINSERISLALEQFMNSIVSNHSRFDAFLGNEITLSATEERGRTLFFAEYNPAFPDESGADCAHCHGGANFDNNRYMNNGLDEEANQSDIGRQNVTNDPMDKAKFKVPSLRNVELTPPYMHDGRFTSLEQVVDHYDHGIELSPTVDLALEYTTQTGLMLSIQDKADLIAFLKTLTDDQLTTDQRYIDPHR
mgnify:CR=1 FL=1|jgi:cytochrome c peroxidase